MSDPPPVKGPQKYLTKSLVETLISRNTGQPWAPGNINIHMTPNPDKNGDVGICDLSGEDLTLGNSVIFYFESDGVLHVYTISSNADKGLRDTDANVFPINQQPMELMTSFAVAEFVMDDMAFFFRNLTADQRAEVLVKLHDTDKTQRQKEAEEERLAKEACLKKLSNLVITHENKIGVETDEAWTTMMMIVGLIDLFCNTELKMKLVGDIEYSDEPKRSFESGRMIWALCNLLKDMVIEGTYDESAYPDLFMSYYCVNYGSCYPIVEFLRDNQQSITTKALARKALISALQNSVDTLGQDETEHIFNSHGKRRRSEDEPPQPRNNAVTIVYDDLSDEE